MPKSGSRYHAGRVNEDIQRELMYILREVKDPRVAKGFVSVIKTETTPDLKFCKVYYSNMNGIDREVKAGLYAAMGFIRRELAAKLNLRQTPELTFIKDTGLEHGARISELLKQIETEEHTAPQDDGDAGIKQE